MKPCLTNFKVLRPIYERNQTSALEWLAHAHTKAEATKNGWDEKGEHALQFHEELKKRLFKIGTGPEKVQSRGSQINDFIHNEWDNMKIYPLHKLPEGINLTERMIFFEKMSDEIFEKFYSQNIALPPHLIHVTCTGYISPSGAQKLVAKRNDSTIVTHAYHMGCYASLPALRIASGFLSSSTQIDIVHTEICSLHMNPLLHGTEQLIVQSLFGDGFIKYSVENEGDVKRSHFSILSLHEETIPNSTQMMTWRCENWGFRMTLAKEVPVMIARTLTPFLKTLVQKAGLKADEVKENAIFAIHPGGPKIIQQVAKILELKEKQQQHSNIVLHDFGNMSSATLPHIWQQMLDDNQIPTNSLVVSLAFGPGLCISGALFKKNMCSC